MPRLHHRKAKTGCIRCKARKVKCDEAKPTCAACERHNVSCDYHHPSPHPIPQQQALPTPPQDTSAASPGWSAADLQKLDHVLEMRLMHEWTAYVSNSISTAWEYWQFKAPLVAFEFRYAMDALLALSALHASRQAPLKTIPMQGHMVELQEPMFRKLGDQQVSNVWKILSDHKVETETREADMQNVNERKKAGTQRNDDMLVVSRMYFSRAIDGHRKALANLTTENIEAVYLTSVLVSFIALFTLSESEDDYPSLPVVDPILWVHLSDGTRSICRTWGALVGPAWMMNSGAFYGKPDLSDQTELFRVENAEPFWKLLTYAQEYERMSEEDQEVYQKALSYIGLLYKGVAEKLESPLASCRRIIAMPATLPDKFIPLLVEKHPRATVILAYGFAVMKLIEDDIKWFQGVAKRQIPKIYANLPPGWREMMKWPMAVAEGNVDKEETAGFLKELQASSQ